MKALLFTKSTLKRSFFTLTLALNLVSLHTFPLWANENIENGTTPVADFAQTSSLILTLLKAFGALILVIGLLVLFSFWLKKLGLSRAGLRQGTLIQVIDTKMIAPKKYVSIVQVGNEVLALGVTDHQITKLSTLDDINPPSSEQVTPNQQASFSSLLGSTLKSGEK